MSHPIPNKPSDATHVWLDGIRYPYHGPYFRRAYYKKVNDIWYSLDFQGNWQESRNGEEWFEQERHAGEFIEIKKD